MKCEQFLSDHLEDGTTCDDAGHRAALARRAAEPPGRRAGTRSSAAPTAEGCAIFYKVDPSAAEAPMSCRPSNTKTTTTAPTSSICRREFLFAMRSTGHCQPDLPSSCSETSAGREFQARHHDGMRFRWPRRDVDA
jgi:hypothetical protein